MELLGAIVFAFPFSKESIGGVTPIRDMVTMFRAESSTRPGRRATFLFFPNFSYKIPTRIRSPKVCDDE